MRVCVVSCWYPSRINPGAGSFVERDVRALAQDHEVHVVHLVAPHLDDGLTHTTTDLVPVLRVPMSPANPVSVARAAAQLRKLTAGSDIIHSMAFPSAEPLRLARPRIPWVHTEHYSRVAAVAAHASAPIRMAARAVLAGPDSVTAVSSYLADALSHLGRPDVQVVPNIVDTRGYVPPREPDGTVRLIAIGSLEAKKDPELAIRTLVELSARGYDATLDWYGTGPLLDQVKSAAAASGIAVRFHPRVPPGEIHAALAGSDVLLHTAPIETFSLVAAEALAAGRPIVIGNRGGHTDFALAPWASLVAERTPAAFADGVATALNAAQLPGFKDFAAELAARFSAESFRASWNNIYTELAPRAAGVEQ